MGEVVAGAQRLIKDAIIEAASFFLDVGRSRRGHQFCRLFVVNIGYLLS